MNHRLRSFYEQEYWGSQYAAAVEAEDHAFYDDLAAFIARFELQDSNCLEIGCGRGAFQDVVVDYTGVDIAHVAGQYLRKPFAQASATAALCG